MDCLKRVKDRFSVYMKKNWAIFLVGLIISIFTIQILLYYATFYDLDFGLNLFSGLADKDWFIKDPSGNFIDDGLEGRWGAFGDFIGGVLNPILGFITIVLLLIANKKDNNRDDLYKKQREIDLLMVRIQKLMEIHIDSVDNLLIFDDDYKQIDKGKMGLTVIFNMIKILTNELSYLKEKGLSPKDILTLSFLLIYNGNISSLAEIISKNFPTINYERDLKEKLGEIKSRVNEKQKRQMFNGFKTVFGTYFRSLFHIIDTINSSDLLESKLKYELIKDIRSQMSHQEQSLLLINSMTKAGKKWNELNFLLKYKLGRNIDRNVDFSGYKLENYIYSIIDEKHSNISFAKRDEIKKRYFEN